MRLAVAEEKGKELERGKLMEVSEFDKEKALLQNRIEYLEKSLEEVKKK